MATLGEAVQILTNLREGLRGPQIAVPLRQACILVDSTSNTDNDGVLLTDEFPIDDEMRDYLVCFIEGHSAKIVEMMNNRRGKGNEPTISFTHPEEYQALDVLSVTDVARQAVNLRWRGVNQYLDQLYIGDNVVIEIATKYRSNGDKYMIKSIQLKDGDAGFRPVEEIVKDNGIQGVNRLLALGGLMISMVDGLEQLNRNKVLHSINYTQLKKKYYYY